MKLIDALTKIKHLGASYFYTRDIMAYLQIERSYASKLLLRLTEAKQLVHLTRGLWALPDIERLALPAVLTAPFPSYVSLHTALYYHGIIMQIPEVIYAISIARTAVIKTDLAAVSIHHIQPDFFFGYESTDNELIKIATPEKALIDFFYFSDSKSKLFTNLPETELPKKFSLSRAKAIIKKIPSARKRTIVTAEFSNFLKRVKRVK